MAPCFANVSGAAIKLIPSLFLMTKQKLTLVGLSLIIVLGFGITYKNLAPVADDGYRSARERALIKRYDTNGDGQLDAQEKAVIKQEAEAEKKLWLERLDLDRDGEISAEEKQAAQVKWEGAKKKDARSQAPQKVQPKPLIAR